MPHTLSPQLARSTRQLSSKPPVNIILQFSSLIFADIFTLTSSSQGLPPPFVDESPFHSSSVQYQLSIDVSEVDERRHNHKDLSTGMKTSSSRSAQPTRRTKCNRELHRGVEPRTFSLRMRCSKPTELMKRFSLAHHVDWRNLITMVPRCDSFL